MDSIPERKWYHKNIAFLLAQAINDLAILNKTTENLVLTHKVLQKFNLWHKHIPRYLKCFEEAGLIKCDFKNGQAPKITLLVVDGRGKPKNNLDQNSQSTTSITSTPIINNNIINKRNLDQNDQVPRPNGLGDLDQNDQVQKSSKGGVGEVEGGRMVEGEGGRGGRVVGGVEGRRVVPRIINGETVWFDAKTGRRIE